MYQGRRGGRAGPGNIPKKIFSASLWIPGKCNHVSRCDVRIFQNIPQPTQRHSQGSKGKIVRKASVRTERRGNGQVHSIHYRYIDGREISGNNKSWQKDIRFCLPSVRSGWQGTKKPDLNGVTGTTSSYDPSTSSDDSDDFLFKFRPISRQGNNQVPAPSLIADLCEIWGSRLSATHHTVTAAEPQIRPSSSYSKVHQKQSPFQKVIINVRWSRNWSGLR